MKNAIARFKTSTFELKKVKNLAITAMLVAISIILSYFSVQVTPTIRVGFSFFPVAIMGFLFGPVVSIIGSISIDFINFVFKPGLGFNPGLTFCAMITGLIYGIFLYQKKIKLPRVVLAWLTNIIISNLLLKSAFLAPMVGLSYFPVLVSRIPPQVITIVIEVALFMSISPVLKELKNK